MLALFGDRVPRPGRLDLALTVIFSALALWLGEGNYTDGPTNPVSEGGPHVYSWVMIPACLLFSLPLLWRSSAPGWGLAAVTAGLGLHALLFGEVVRCGVAFPVIGLLAFTAAAQLSGRALPLAFALSLASTLLVGFVDVLGPGVLVVGLPVVLAAFAAGLLAASRSRLAAELQEQNTELQHARDERARLEVATDRAELSGELDALLQQRLAALAALADEGERSTSGSQAAAVLAEIEAQSRTTLDEMRQLVGALRGSDGALATSPMPTLTSLEALVVRSRGPRSRVQIAGNPRVLPPGVELAAYRIVEHLLGALDDESGVDVTVRFEADRLELQVQGQARRRAEFASGLARARARVELHHGTLSSTTSGGRAATTASLPMLLGA